MSKKNSENKTLGYIYKFESTNFNFAISFTLIATKFLYLK